MYTLQYLISRVVELEKETVPRSLEHAITGICEGHELSRSQESDLRNHFKYKDGMSGNNYDHWNTPDGI